MKPSRFMRDLDLAKRVAVLPEQLRKVGGRRP
jgi:hypothetical protein